MKPRYQARKNAVAGSTKRLRARTSSWNSGDRSAAAQSMFPMSPPGRSWEIAQFALPDEPGRQTAGGEGTACACRRAPRQGERLGAALALALLGGGVRRRRGRHRIAGGGLGVELVV